MKDNKTHTDIFYWAEDKTVEREGTRVESLEQLEAIAQAQQDNGREITQITMNLSKNSSWQAALQALKQLRDKWPELAAHASEALELMPYIEEELKNPKYQGKAIEELAFEASTDENGEPAPDSLFMIAMNAARESRKKDVNKKNLPTLRSEGTPKYYMIPNSTLENALQAIDGKGDIVDAGPLDLPVLNIGTSKEITVYVDATLENEENTTVYANKNPTEYDRAVEAAIISLVEDRTKNGLPPIITADMIYRTMTHKTQTEKVSDSEKTSVIDSIDKMRKGIYIKLDATSELQARGILGPDDEFSFEDFMLSAIKIKAKSGGRVVDAYMIKSILLWEYTKLNRQYYTIKGDLLDIKKLDSKGRLTTTSIHNTENRIAVKNYILRRILIMKSDKEKAKDNLRKYNSRRKHNKDLPEKTLKDYIKKKPIIVFDTVYNAADITHPNTKTRIKKYIFDVLRFYQAKGIIKGFTERKRNGKIKAAVEIEI